MPTKATFPRPVSRSYVIGRLVGSQRKPYALGAPPALTYVSESFVTTSVTVGCPTWSHEPWIGGPGGGNRAGRGRGAGANASDKTAADNSDSTYLRMGAS